MPWLIRLIGSLFLYRLVQRRFQAARAGGAARAMPRVNVPVRDVVDDLGIGTHLMVATGAAIAALLLGAVALTLLILGPRWLGAVVVALAIFGAGVAWWQGHKFSRLLQMRNWRHHKVGITSDDETRKAQ